MTKPPEITHEGEVIESTSLIRVDPIVKPAVSAQVAIQAWNEYQNLKRQIAAPEDFQTIQGKDFPKKSLWRKLATFFNLSVEVVSEKEIKNEDGTLDFDVVYRALAPNGRSSVGDGSCNSREKGRENSRHNTRSTAHTRAFNRAISNLIGGGEVSAEEVTDHDFEEPRPRASKPAPSSKLELTSPAVYRPEYRIELGLVKMKGHEQPQPHWLNGKTIEEAAHQFNRATKQSVLKDSVDFYKNSKGALKPHVQEFLEQAQAFYDIQNQKEAEQEKEKAKDLDIPF